MNFLKKHWASFLIIIGLAFLYFLLRLPNLTSQPIFADEAIYIRWAQVMRAEPTLRFLPLSDGKTPLFMWIMIPFLKVFADPLLAGRFLSVMAGFLTMFGGLTLGWKFLNKNVGLLTAFLIAISPMMVFFDRMALVDSMLAAFSIWSLIFALWLIKYKRVDLAMGLGFLFGGGLLTKTPAFFNLLVLPVSLFLFNFKDKQRQIKLLKIFGLWMIALVITLSIYSILKLGPNYGNLSSRNQDYIFSPMEVLLKHPLDPLVPHLRDVFDFLTKLLTPPVFLLFLGGVVFGLFKRNWTVAAIFYWAFIPLFLEMLFLQTFTARYILFSIPPFLCLTAWFLHQMYILYLKRQGWLLAVVLLVAISIWPVVSDLTILVNPALAWLPKQERRGYLEDWTAGYGFSEIAEYIKTQDHPVVGTEGSFGTLPDGLQIYLDKSQSVSFIPGGATISPGLLTAALDHPTFFVANKSRFGSAPSNLKLIKEYPKAVGDLPADAILFYQVTPK